MSCPRVTLSGRQRSHAMPGAALPAASPARSEWQTLLGSPIKGTYDTIWPESLHAARARCTTN